MKIAVCALCFGMLSNVAHAVCLNGHPSVETEFLSSKYVLTGFVISGTVDLDTKDDFITGYRYRVMPLTILKGHLQGPIKLYTANDSGRFPMELAKRYLLFIGPKEQGRYSIDNCGNSNDLDHVTSGTMTRVQALIPKSGGK